MSLRPRCYISITVSLLVLCVLASNIDAQTRSLFEQNSFDSNQFVEGSLASPKPVSTLELEQGSSVSLSPQIQSPTNLPTPAMERPSEFMGLNDFATALPSSEQMTLWKRLENAPVSLGALWLSDSESGLTRYDSSVKFPILRLFGSPPPIVKTGFSFTELYAAPSSGLPRELFEYTMGVSKVYRVNDRWTIRSMLGIGLATDNKNRSSDAWQFRGGVFGIYQWNEQWQWSIGAIALGRNDLPAVPALGAVWQPNESIRWDLIPPNPKVNFLLNEFNSRQNWLYLGGGFNGTTWGYRTALQQNDRLTYRDLRLVAGWQSQPTGQPGIPYVRGRKYNLELGYVFSRELEFNQDQTQRALDDAWMIRLESRY